MNAAQHFRINEPDVVWECVDGEAVLIDFRTGCYFSVTNVGADALRLLAAGHSVASAIEVIASAFAKPVVEVARDVESYVRQLETDGLLAATQFPSPSPAACTLEAKQYAAPVVEKFTDMADQLLLDPIHEIHEQGWPANKAA